MSDFLIKQILDNIETDQDAIVKILQARGFLIEKCNEKYYLSDNATVNDAEYLSEGLIKYQIGRVINNKEYVESRRRNWGVNALYRSYSYYSLQPRKVEIVLSKDASVDAAIDFFNDSGRTAGESSWMQHSWLEFVIESLGPKADVRYLEAYVAYYVKAISACGVYTCRSCDGNHPQGGSIYVNAEYPSDLWHHNIWEYIIQPRFGSLPFIGTGIDFTSENQRVVYNTVYRIADYLYSNRKQIRAMKYRTTIGINHQFIKAHTLDEIEAFYNDECRNVLLLYTD